MRLKTYNIDQSKKIMETQQEISYGVVTLNPNAGSSNTIDNVNSIFLADLLVGK